MNRIPRRAVAALAAAVLTGGLAACAPDAPAEPTITTLKTNALAVHIAGNWNPVTSTYLNTYFAPQQAVYETLIRLNGATYEFEPLLAEEFEIEDDQRTMNLRLREDVDFSDGTHLDAESAKASLGFLEQGANSFLFEQYEVEVEVTGEYELRVTSSLPMNSDFLYSFAILPIVSPTAIEDDPEGLEQNPVGTGPYLLDEQVAEVSASFVRNPDYRDPEAFPFDEVEFLVIEDPIAASNALKSGQINVAGRLDAALADDLKADGFTVRVGGGVNWVLVWRDVDGAIAPALADVRVRQAIAHAIDRAAIIEAVDFGYGTGISQAWGPGSAYYLEGEDDRYAFDPDEAKRLLAEAGYPDGFDLALPSHPLMAKYEPALGQALADIGITATFDQYPWDTTWAQKAANYGMYLARGSDLFLANSLRAEHIEFPGVRELFDVMAEGTPAEARAAQQELAQLVLDEALVIGFARPSEPWATIPEITVDVGIINLWPPLLSAYQLAE